MPRFVRRPCDHICTDLLKFGDLAALATAHLGLFRWERTAGPTKTGGIMYILTF